MLLLWTPHAFAWGGLGHRITGEVAEALLTDAAHRQVQQLLGDEPLAIAATFMDQQRETLRERWPASLRWHYDNQAACGDAPTDCADGNCATRQIERFRQLLANRQASQTERALALRLLIHLLGDIHQPLHMADNDDRGGNTLYVRLYAGGERYRLHEVLDTVLLKEMVGAQRSADYARGLRQRYQAHFIEWQRGTTLNWAEQTHQLAITHTYGLLPGFACHDTDGRTLTLPGSYIADARQYLPEQLAKAGVRIAAVLNLALQ